MARTCAATQMTKGMGDCFKYAASIVLRYGNEFHCLERRNYIHKDQSPFEMKRGLGGTLQHSQNRRYQDTYEA